MNTYTIVATDSWEKLDNTYLSLVCSIIPEADIELSYDGGVTSAPLLAGIGITVSFQNPILYVKGTQAKKVYIYNGAIQTISDNVAQSGAGSPEGVVASHFPGDIYTDTDTGEIYSNPAIADTGWVLISNVIAVPVYVRPTSGVISPEGVVTSRFIGDTYIDTVAHKMYANDGLLNTGRFILN